MSKGPNVPQLEGKAMDAYIRAELEALNVRSQQETTKEKSPRIEDGSNPIGFYNRANYYLKTKQYKKASQDYLSAITLNPCSRDDNIQFSPTRGEIEALGSKLSAESADRAYKTYASKLKKRSEGLFIFYIPPDGVAGHER